MTKDYDEAFKRVVNGPANVVNLGNMGNDHARLCAAAYQLKQVAFTLETIAHLGGLETALLGSAALVRNLAESMDKRLVELEATSENR